MNISNFAVKNAQFTLVIFLMIIAIGATTLMNMSRSEDPEIKSPQFPVIVVYPGTSPKDMEDLVADPIEKVVSGMEDIKRIKTSITDGVVVMEVEFLYSVDYDKAYQDLVREVTSLRSTLPADVYSIEVQKALPSDVKILQMALVSENANKTTLQKEADRLEDELEKIKELKKIEIHGLPDKTVRVDLDLQKIAQMRVSVNAVLGALQSEGANIPGGAIEAGEKTFNIKTSGNFVNAEDVAQTIIMAAGGKNIYLRDIAHVYNSHDEDKHITRLNGHRAVFVTAALKPGNNISKIKEKYEPILAAYTKALPANIILEKQFDQADNVNHRLAGLGTDFLIAILLVSITLLPLGGRAALIVMISIPLSLSIGLFMLDALGITLNQLSIVGLVVALGLLVDDSIVVVENIERWIRDGHSRTEATLLATKQIGVAVIGTTATLIIAFMPLAFLPGAAGDFIKSLPLAVITSVFASMLVSLTIIPFLSSRILKDHTHGATGNLFLRALQTGIHKTYAPVLNLALKHPVITLIVGIGIFVASLQIFPIIGFTLFPASEKPQFLVNIKAPLQTNITTTNKIAGVVEAELKKHSLVQYFSTNVGKGNPRVYYNEIPSNENPSYAQVFVQLHEGTSTVDKLALIEELRGTFSQVAGAKIEVKNFEQGPPVVAPVEVRLVGDNLDTLRALAFKVEKILKATPGTIYIDNPVSNLKSDIKVAINKEKASQLGVPSVEIDRTVRLAVAGLQAGSFSGQDGDDYKIMVGRERGAHPTLDALSNLYINNIQGVAVPLSQLASLQMDASPTIIRHFDKKRTVSVSAFLKKGYQSNKVIEEVVKSTDKLKLPAGYSYNMGGDVEAQQDSFGGFEILIVITVFAFIAVLVLEFKTFKSTLIVLSVIPLGVVGASIALWLTGNPLSFVAIIGLIALAGIEVKNSILLVDFTNQLRAEGRSLEDAIREAGEIRFLPIVLTSLTAIGGLIPIALSTNPLISPLADVLIGGLVSSTLLSRVITPVIYKLLPPNVELLATNTNTAPAQATH